MATERRALLALGLGALVVAGGACSPIVDRCRAGTLLVAVSLDAASASADGFVIDVALDGGTPAESTLAHVPGQPAGNVLVQFPRGYPTGSVATVTVTALAGGVVVGRGTAGATLVAGCQSTMLAVRGDGTAGDDLAVAPDDAGDAGESGDLAPAADLATAAHDLATPPDMVCPGGGVELCFNGIDDDCDGHIDCDDPDCAPVAICVPPATGSFSYGTEEPKAGSCPAGTTSAPLYSNSDPTGGGCNSSCACNTGGCTATLNQLNDTCPGGTNLSFLANVTTTCNTPTDVSGRNNWRATTPTGTMTCGSNGSATPVMPAVVPSVLQCSDSATPVAGGCSGANVCVPRGSKQCVFAAGSASCPGGYANQATWFTSFTDNRTCSCSCAPGASGCAGAKVTQYKTSSCGGTSAPVNGDICSNDYAGIKIAGGCALTVTPNNPLVFNGQRTVCCQ